MSDTLSLRDLMLAIGLWSALVASSLFHGSSIDIGMLATVVAAVLIAATLVRPHLLASSFREQPWPGVLAFATLGYLAIAYQWSLSPETSYPRIWAIALLPITFLVVWSLPAGRAPRLLEAGVVVLVVGLATLSTVRFLAFGEIPFRPLTDPNNYASLMYLVWIPLAHAYLTRRWMPGTRNAVQHFAALASSLVLLTALFASESRTGIAIVLVAMLVWLALTVSGRLEAKRFLPLAGMVVIAAVLSGFAASASDAGIGIEKGIGVRGALATAAFEMFLEYPITGIGISCFQLLYPIYRATTEQETAGVFVHNDYLQFLTEGGVAFLLLLLIFAGAAGWSFLRGLRARPDSAAFRGLGYAMALCAVCAHAFVNFVFYVPALAIVIGMTAAQLARAGIAPENGEVPDAPASSSRRAILFTFAGGAAFGWVAWLFLMLDVAVYGVFYGQQIPFADTIRADADKALRFARVAEALNGRRGVPPLAAATIQYRQALVAPAGREDVLAERALADFKRALAVDPWNPEAYVGLASLLRSFPDVAKQRGDGDRVEELLFRALSIDPLNVAAIDGLRGLYDSPEELGRRYALMRRLVQPWLPSIKARDPDAAKRYLEELERLARAWSNEDHLRELKAVRETLRGVRPIERRTWT